MPDKIALSPVPPKEAVDYFRKKGYKLTVDWHEMQREEHAYNFTVAKVTSLDLLQDIRRSVDKAIADGITFNDFQKELKPILADKGWWGRKTVTDPNTGEEREVQLGSPRRLKIIFDTNLRTSYAAGRWEQVQRTKKTRPYLRYVAVLDNRTRDQHRNWHNTVLPADDPFWNEHYPPNGWRCRCTVQQLGPRDLKRLGLDVSNTPPSGAPKTYIDKKTGETIHVPPGVDPAFSYNVGQARMKAMTPPLLDRPLNVPFTGDLIAAPPPPARVIDPKRILTGNLDDATYVKAFLKEFGGDISKPVPFVDKAGETILISEDLFKTPDGAWKIKKRDRHIYALLLADAIRDPDEIFHAWEEYPKGEMSLSRVYLSRWLDDDGKTIGGYTMLAIGAAGWSGVTSFQGAEKYLAKQRRGALVYRRGK